MEFDPEVYRRERLQLDKLKHVKTKEPCTNCCCEYLHCYLCFLLIIVLAGVSVWVLGYIQTNNFLDLGTFMNRNNSQEGNYENATVTLKKLLKADSLRFNVPIINRIDISENILLFRNLVDRLDCEENSKKKWVFQSAGKNFPGHACGIPKPGSAPSVKFLTHISQKLAKIGCSDEEDCSSPNCDPYLSVFESSLFCFIGTLFRKLRKPELTAWKSDKQFSLNFIQGVNPLTIRKVQNMSEVHTDLQNLEADVDGEVLSVAQILKKEKLFLADYSELDSIPLHQNFVFYSPQVLLSLDRLGDLDIVGILLRTNKQSKSHVLTKASSENHMLFAKMHVANADAAIHEFSNHLKIHLVMEAIAIGVHNHLSGHTLGRLLEPHMEGTIFINFFARQTLIKDDNDSDVDRMFSVGRDGALKLVADNLKNNFNFTEAAFPRMMGARGFPKNESDGVADFFYRRDGYKLWDILTKYVKGVVNKVYKEDIEVEKDEALNRFTQSMFDEKQGNIPGFPANITTKDILIDTLTNIIFTASVQHQALNAPHHFYSYIPHRPTFLTKWMPDEEKQLTWEWIKTALPTMEQAKEVYDLAMLLATHSLCTLADLDEFEDEFPDVQKELNRNLNKLSFEIESRDSDYNYLDPARVACSIDI